jgi:hypothetical protein
MKYYTMSTVKQLQTFRSSDVVLRQSQAIQYECGLPGLLYSVGTGHTETLVTIYCHTRCIIPEEVNQSNM